MRSVVCGLDNLEALTFCDDCGAGLSDSYPPATILPAQPEHVKPKRSSTGSNRRNLVAIVVLMVIVVAALGIIFVAPTSQIRLVAHNHDTYSIAITLLIDGREKVAITLNSEQNITRSWHVVSGSHLVEINYHFLDYSHEYPWSIIVQVERFSTVNVEAPLASGFSHSPLPMAVGAILSIS